MTVLAHFGVAETDFLGQGGQSRVYALGMDRVLRLYRSETDPRFAPALRDFYAALVVPPLPFAIPQIFETGTHDGVSFAIEARLPGAPLLSAMATLGARAQDAAVRGFMQAPAALCRIRHPQSEFGEILPQVPIRAGRWKDFLALKGAACARRNPATLRTDVPNLDRAMARYRERLEALPEPVPSLVHGDYYAANVLVAPDGAVTAVIDFSPLTLIGDATLDVVGAWHALEALESVAPAARKWAHAFMRETLGPSGQMAFDTYSAYLALIHSGARDEAPALYRWCVRTLSALGA